MARGTGMLSLMAMFALHAAVSAAPAQEPAQAARDLGAAPQEISYQAEGLRDPLKSLLPPPPPPTPPPQSQAAHQAEIEISPPAAALQGMLWGGRQPSAIINGDVYKVGDVVVGAKIVSIDRWGVTVDVSGRQFVLTPSKGAARGPGQGYSAARSVPMGRAR